MHDIDRQNKRPLSPHLTIYKPIVTMIASIVHRMTGVVLYFGTLLLALWLVSIASGEVYFNYANMIIGNFLGQLVLFGFTWALIQHGLGGIKHLFWDMGYGFDKDVSTKIAWLSFIVSSILTCMIWFIAYVIR